MKIYTRTGDDGMTSLINDIRVSKTDDRIELLGQIDELSAMIGMAKVIADDTGKEELSVIQQELIKIMAKIADSENENYNVTDESVAFLEKTIDNMENLISRDGKFVLYGQCELSARLDVARAVARRVERHFYKVKMQYETDEIALKYINRLSDYLYILARHEEEKIK